MNFVAITSRSCTQFLPRPRQTLHPRHGGYENYMNLEKKSILKVPSCNKWLVLLWEILLLSPKLFSCRKPSYLCHYRFGYYNERLTRMNSWGTSTTKHYWRTDSNRFSIMEEHVLHCLNMNCLLIFEEFRGYYVTEYSELEGLGSLGPTLNMTQKSQYQPKSTEEKTFTSTGLYNSFTVTVLGEMNEALSLVLVEGVPAHARGVGTRWSLMFLPMQTIL